MNEALDDIAATSAAPPLSDWALKRGVYGIRKRTMLRNELPTRAHFPKRTKQHLVLAAGRPRRNRKVHVTLAEHA